jgi:hypothetical protein
MALTLPTVSFISIATNRYLEYWKNQAKSVNTHTAGQSDIKLFLFTDQVAEARAFAEGLPNLSVEIEEIPSYGWPEATLLRYEIISQSGFHWESDEILVYLDADMEVVAPLKPSDFVDACQQGICLVQHPGYYRPGFKHLWRVYSKNPKILLGDLLLRLSEGGLGYWETRKNSMAYVPRSRRREYFCGGIWWGRSQDILPLAFELARAVGRDLSQGIVAKWHDESHLNAWAARNSHEIKGPAYCFVPEYKWLNHIEAKIVAVDKGPIERS